MDEDYRRYPGAVSDGLYRGLRIAGFVGLVVLAAGSVLQLALNGAGIETSGWAMAPQWIGTTLFVTTSIIQSIDDRQRYKAMLEAEHTAAAAARARRNPLRFLVPGRSR
ncbi:hypothetical protein GCM10010988_41550 [Cnuibacter physcomitrellae]|uniref:Uncharacterized protein n=1 Tax=Cnuibacter physcomitrellae TaxID=1619308 RepID=A0A1X9LTZ8_9MICO|nr:hypothetical protein [Cnuibacter physcomitrellae]ARJ07798.1 hypothetical protein B5808_20625 [Cnuibacter physcomitrellae]GGI42940.1 hypothetical protein GCM10010988_41550 [Cnuibacter physcomitrellae]